MILIELDGERQLVTSLEGYDDWTVVQEDVPDQPSDFHRLEDGVWVENVAEKEAVEEEARLAALPRSELIAELNAKFESEMAKRDFQIAQIAEASFIMVTPLDAINLDEPTEF